MSYNSKYAFENQIYKNTYYVISLINKNLINEVKISKCYVDYSSDSLNGKVFNATFYNFEKSISETLLVNIEFLMDNKKDACIKYIGISEYTKKLVK